MAELTGKASCPLISMACTLSGRVVSAEELVKSCQPDPQVECTAAKELPQPLNIAAGDDKSF